ncbi:hypothetical protein [Streptomyces sp. NPDC052042]|uniref:hypothetical protein n=1 Tax=Streptomyces sp. NPDC052042 TaxID=3365683 RepID=UPI0037D6113C
MSIPVARAGAGVRLLRATVFTAVCVVLSAAGHALASCAAIPWWTLLAGFLGIFALIAPLAGRERSLPSIAAALAGGQIALHALFSMGTPAAPMASPTGADPLIRFAASLVCGAGPARLNAADAHRIVATAGIDPASVTERQQHLTAVFGTHPDGLVGLLPGLPMLLGHLLAAVATGWMLRRGEIALSGLVRLSAYGARQVAAGARLRALRAALALVAALRAGLPGSPMTGPRTPRTRDDIPLPVTEALQHTVIVRGPPPAYALAA